MTQTREKLLQALGEMSSLYPHWRMGQMIENLVGWARQPKNPSEAAAGNWEIEDEELIAVIQDHLKKRHESSQCAPEIASKVTS